MTVAPAAGGRSARALARLTIVAVLSGLLAVGFVAPASAHNVLLSSNPADGAVLQAAPSTVQLTFDQPVQNFEPVVTVLGPDGQRYESGAPQVDSTEVSAEVGALPGTGDYVIAYRVVSADGHPVQGEIRFRLEEVASSAAGPGSGAAASSGAAGSGAAASGAAGSGGSQSASSTPPAPTTAAAVAPAASSSGLSGWVWAAIALAAILVAAAIVVIVRRPRSERTR